MIPALATVCLVPLLPVVHVDVSNEDAGGRQFSYQTGGDYRGGREVRRDLELVAGQTLPVTLRFG